MYEDGEELSNWVKHLKTSKNEVAVLQVLGKQEAEFSYSGALVFEDLETGKRVKVDAKDTKEYYLKKMGEALKESKDSFLAKDIGYDLFRFDEPIQESLQFFLKRRNNLS